MSPRPKSIKKIACGSIPAGFLPAGGEGEKTIELHYEEYEALRLCDYEDMIQQEAAELMGISRPTLTRIYSSARKKVVQALVEECGIIIKGGTAYKDPSWYLCPDCGLKFNSIRPESVQEEMRCPGCGSADIRETNGNQTTTSNKHIMKKIVLPTRDGRIDDHFGHCASYTIFSVDENGKVVEREEMPSPQSCGCKSGVADEFQKKGITLMLAGNMGNGALSKLNAAGVEVIRGCHGDVQEVLGQYLAGNLKDSGVGCANHEHHHGDGEHECHHGCHEE